MYTRATVVARQNVKRRYVDRTLLKMKIKINSLAREKSGSNYEKFSLSALSIV